MRPGCRLCRSNGVTFHADTVRPYVGWRTVFAISQAYLGFPLAVEGDAYSLPTNQEAFMTQKTPDQHQKPEQHQDELNKQEVAKQEQKAAEREVAGRHKSDGKNDHAGHKESR